MNNPEALFCANAAFTVTDTVLRDYFDNLADPQAIVLDHDRISTLLSISIDYADRIRRAAEEETIHGH